MSAAEADPPPTVSVVIAVYNAEAALRKTLASVLAQSYPRVELIVIDGKSSDGTWSVVEEFSKSITYKVSERDRGIPDAYNKGIKAATGDWIYFLNADDVFADEHVLTHLFANRHIDAKTNLLVGTVLSTDGRLFDGRFGWLLLVRNHIHHQAIFYRAGFLRALPYNVEYRTYGHDHEHNILVWRRGEAVMYVPIVVAIWARGGISDRASWKQYREEFKVRRNSVGALGYPFNVFSLIRFLLKRLRQT